MPKCATDRSFAIAHGLEDVFWVEGSDGKWTARKKPPRPVEELVRERTSSSCEGCASESARSTRHDRQRRARSPRSQDSCRSRVGPLMDKDTRTAIERATQRARKLLAEDFSAQLEGEFDVQPTGIVAAKAGRHLDPSRAAQRSGSSPRSSTSALRR